MDPRKALVLLTPVAAIAATTVVVTLWSRPAPEGQPPSPATLTDGGKRSEPNAGDGSGGTPANRLRREPSPLDALWETDRDQALAWVRSQVASGLSPEVADRIAGVSDDTRGSLVQELVAHSCRGEGGWESAFSWAAAANDQALRSTALEALAHHAEGEAIATLAEWVALNFDDPASGRALAVVAGKFAEADPEAALDWVALLPAGENRGRSLEEVARLHTRSDSLRSIALLQGRIERADDPLGWDPALLGAVTALRDSDVIQAARVAAMIQDETVREDVLRQVIEQWKESDPVMAERWLLAQTEDRGRVSNPGGRYVSEVD